MTISTARAAQLAQHSSRKEVNKHNTYKHKE